MSIRGNAQLVTDHVLATVLPITKCQIKLLIHCCIAQRSAPNRKEPLVPAYRAPEGYS